MVSAAERLMSLGTMEAATAKATARDVGSLEHLDQSLPQPQVPARAHALRHGPDAHVPRGPAAAMETGREDAMLRVLEQGDCRRARFEVTDLAMRRRRRTRKDVGIERTLLTRGLLRSWLDDRRSRLRRRIMCGMPPSGEVS
jgi:hypothetical protein